MTLFFICVALIIGIVASKCYYLFIPLAIIFIIFAFKRGNKRIGILVLILIPLGYGISFIRFDFDKPNYEGIVIESKDNYFILSSSLEKLYVYSKDNNYEIGDILNIYGNKSKLDFEVLESDFNFNEYLNDKNIYYQLNVSNIDVRFSNPIRINNIRNNFLNSFSNEETRYLVGSILFSDGNDSELKKVNSSIHLSRLFSASGLYLTFFINLIEHFLSKKLSKSKSKIITFSILTPYFIFVFPKLSVIKIFLGFIIYIINRFILKDKLTYLSRHFLTSLIILVFDFSFAKNDSYILITFIPFFLYLINNSFLHLKKWKRKTLSLIGVFLFFIPFEISYYNCLVPLSFLFSLILTPIFYVFAFLSLLTFYKLPLSFVLNPFANMILKLLNLIRPVAFSINMPSFNPLVIAFYYCFLFLLFYLYSIRLYLINKIPIVVLTSIILINALPIKNCFTSEVTFINVGQGDSMLLRCHNNSLLIDTGGLTYKDVATSSLIPFLKKKKIYCLDYVIITHSDNDHMGALESLKSNFKVKSVIDSSKQFPIYFN